MRVAIIGNSGSGKTTLAHRLVPDAHTYILDLDTVAWEPDKIAVARSMEKARSDVRAFCRSHKSWIVEGCYAGLVEAALGFNPHLLVWIPAWSNASLIARIVLGSLTSIPQRRSKTRSCLFCLTG